MSAWKEETFQGVIGRTVEESVPWWPKPDKPSEGRPNIVIILLDDLGFAHLGCYGSDIHTPHMDALAAGGLRYNNFHTTAICSPTRASLLTGRNPHSAGVSFVSEYDSGFPHSRGKVRKDTALISEILLEHGYSTYAVGKWHLTPGKEQSNVGPFDNWPLGRGFEHYYGFLSGATSQWYPDLVEDNRRVPQPKTPEEGYHLTEDLTDKAIEYIRDHHSAAPDKPFFCYLAYGATHAPHHAPKEFIDKYKGKYDKGWDCTREEWFARQQALGIIPADAKLPPRNPGVKAWDELSADEQRLYARMQEAFAGFLEHTDYHIGRFIDFLKTIGQLDNTLILLLSDNGACAMGGKEGTVNSWNGLGTQESFESKLKRIDEIGSPLANNHYPAGWAQVGNTPLKWYKSFVHAGGVKDPLIIHYPEKIKDAGAIRSQYHHVIDIVPTILELLHIEAPSVLKGVPQKPIEGVSLAYTFDDGSLPTRKEIQYYEMVGNRAIYYKGWKAVAAHKPDTPFEEDSWELYRVDEDYSEMNDLAGQKPEILRDLIDRWWVEAGKYGVLPLDGRSLAGKIRARKSVITQPAGPVRRKYYPSPSRFHASVAPDLRNKSFEIRVPLSRHTSEEEGVLISQGDGSGGYVLYIQNNRLVFYYNYSGIGKYTVISDQELPAGSIVLRLLMLNTGDNEGTVKMFIENRQIGEGTVGHTGFLGFAGGAFQIGRDDQSAVSPAYAAPFAFTGTIDHVAITLGAYDFDVEAAVIRELATE
ncbi:arylsulfatase [Paenibacillus naphthalenovorans]|uniref:arylsulfatase n=1 Tax=Paenibacillus naphthalenovorans TaxID=162209 RepID=UPI00088BC0FC|nr:arylsulfatase [Paenibacillus naphthalenovorans]GCL71177.1 arylsulfatase [Paenibacillus naphthalenovorans]SDI01405.1 arylsulfatase [Paenibacillus naphthalenovorans]